MNDVTIPDWVLALVGRLTLENEALRQALAQQSLPVTNGHVPEPEPVQ